MDRGAWQAIVQGVTKCQTCLGNFHFLTFLVAAHSSVASQEGLQEIFLRYCLLVRVSYYGFSTSGLLT